MLSRGGLAGSSYPAKLETNATFPLHARPPQKLAGAGSAAKVIGVPTPVFGRVNAMTVLSAGVASTPVRSVPPGATKPLAWPATAGSTEAVALVVTGVGFPVKVTAAVAVMVPPVGTAAGTVPTTRTSAEAPAVSAPIVQVSTPDAFAGPHVPGAA